MKSVFALILLLALPAPAQTASSAPAKDPGAVKARALIDEMIKALGGEAWLTFQDRTEEGRSYAYYQGRPNSVGAAFWRFWKWPDKDRIELTKQRDVIYVNVGDDGYEITFKGTALQELKANEDYNRRRAHSLETVIRDWLKRLGTILLYDGPAVAEQRAVHSVTIINAENDSVTLFIDQFRHLPIKKTFTWRDPTDRLKNEEGEMFDHYREQQGIMTPFSVLRSHNGKITNQRFITKVQYNTGIPDSMFEMRVSYGPKTKAEQKE